MQPGGALQLADIDGPIAFGALHKGQFVGFIVDCEFCGSIHYGNGGKGNDYQLYAVIWSNFIVSWFGILGPLNKEKGRAVRG